MIFKAEQATWAADLRPREKLYEKGKKALTNTELLAIILGTGTSKMSAMELANHILEKTNGQLKSIARLNLADLTKINGVGLAKAARIISCLELGVRRSAEQENKVHLLSSSRQVFLELKPQLSDLLHEEFWAIYVNRKQEVLRKDRISTGGFTSTVVDQRMVLRGALQVAATALIVGHNHPSGNCKPSKQDLQVTAKLKKACALMDIPLLDHVIVTSQDYFSFADEGLL